MTNSKVQLAYTWSFDLTPEDARLVLKALGGRLTKGDAETAKELGDRLTRQRAAHAKHLAEQMTTHADNIDA